MHIIRFELVVLTTCSEMYCSFISEGCFGCAEMGLQDKDTIHLFTVSHHPTLFVLIYPWLIRTLSHIMYNRSYC